MFSIESSINNNHHFHLSNDNNKILCSFINISSLFNDEMITETLNIIDIISKENIVVVNLDPTIPYQKVEQFQKENVHLLRLHSDNLYLKKDSPFYLLHHDKLAYLDVRNNNLTKDINLELYIPKIINDYFTDIFFNYSIFNNSAIITTNTKNNINILNKVFLDLLHVEDILYLFNDEEKIIAKFIDDKNVFFAQDPNDINYKNNILKLESKYNVINLPYIKKEISFLDYYQNDNILIIPDISKKHNKEISSIFNSYYKNVSFVVAKELIKNKISLDNFIINIPYSNSHKFLDK